MPHEAFEGSYLLGLKTNHLMLLRRYEEAGHNIERHLEYHRERPTEYCESSIRAQAGGVAAVQGEPGKGMAAFLREVEMQARRNQRFIDTVFHVFLAETYVRIANQEVVPPIGVLLRNLGLCSATRCRRSDTRGDASSTDASRLRSSAFGALRRGSPSQPLALPTSRNARTRRGASSRRASRDVVPRVSRNHRRPSAI